ncbi:MAG: BON domain-containing protein [Pyrinomonadaceae bacterium MAG19_C2-C3]|nr:BON domain-containing protein [Pyrinomonadaceae bacterium MAG19_C2-C3]
MKNLGTSPRTMRILSILTVTCAILLTTMSVTYAQTSNNRNRRPQRPALGRGSVDRRAALSRTQTQIIREVRSELATLPYYDVFDWLQFEVRPDNSVILSGQTVRPTLKRDAESRLRDIESISRVVNNIEVLPLSPQDDRIRVAVYRTLFNFDSPLYRYALGAVPSIRIIVNRGRVTLKGIVNSEFDRNYANVQVRGVPGIFEVTNELQIEGQQAR